MSFSAKFISTLALVYAFAAVASADNPCPLLDAGGAYSSELTYYDPFVGNGACGFDPAGITYPRAPSSDADQYVAAISAPMYAGGKACGT